MSHLVEFAPPNIRRCSSAGEALNRFYIPVLVPVGIVGNILSFLVRGFSI